MKELINLKAPQHLISVKIFLKLMRLEEIFTLWLSRLSLILANMVKESKQHFRLS